MVKLTNSVLLILFLISLCAVSAQLTDRREKFRSLDHGDWSKNELVSWDSRSNSFYVQMAIGPDDVIHVVWQDESNISQTCIEPNYAYRLPNSNTWSHNRWLFNETRSLTVLCADAYRPTIAIDSHNNIYTVYYAHTNETDHDWDQDLFETVRLADGTWLSHKQITPESYWDDYDPRIAIGPDDKQHLVYSEYGNYSQNGWDYDVLYKQRGYGAEEWTLAETVSTESTADSTKPDLVVDSDSVVHVVWEDYTNYQGSCSDWDIFYKTRSSNGVWSPAQVISWETMCNAYDAYDPSIAIGPDDSIHVAWKDNSPYGGNNATYVFKILYKMKPYNGAWTTAELVSTESVRDAQAPDVVVGNDGTVYIAWYDSTNFTEPESINDTDIVIKKKPLGGNWTDLQMISWYNNTDASLEPSIAIKDGRLHAVWEDSTDYGNPDASRDILYSTTQPGEQYTFLLDGYVSYADGTPAGNVQVEILNDDLTNSQDWKKVTFSDANGYFALPPLFPGLDIFIRDWIRITAKDDSGTMKNVQDNISWSRHYVPQHVQFNISLTDHYVYLEGMPYYIANNEPYDDSGAAAAQMVLNYLMWNASEYPEPEMTFPDQTWIFQQFNVGLGAAYLNGDEMPNGLNMLINDSGNNWKYGYFFQRFNTSNQTAAINQLITWMDYPIDHYNEQREIPVPAMGHPNHAPVLFPYYNYERWNIVKGIHTNASAWPPNGQAVKIYGVWLVDASDSPYFTEEYFSYTSFVNYFTPISQSGDPYNGKYLVVTDPPQGIALPESNRAVEGGVSPAKFDEDCAQRIRDHGITKATTPRIIDAAKAAARDVFSLDPRRESFERSTPIGNPVEEDDGFAVSFVDKRTTYVVSIDKEDGHLKRIGVRMHPASWD